MEDNLEKHEVAVSKTVLGQTKELAGAQLSISGTDADGNMQLKDELVADTGIGPAQICIRDLGDKAEILVSCYLIGQLAKYTITNS